MALMLIRAEHQATETAARSAHGASANHPGHAAVKKESLGDWHKAMEKKLTTLKEQEMALRFAALKHQSGPGDAVRLEAVRKDYARQLVLLNRGVALGEGKIQRYKTRQADGQPLTRAQKKELAALEMTVLEMRMTRLQSA